MSLRLKLLISIVAVGLVPLGVSAYATLSLHQRAFEERTAQLHRKAAEYGAATLQSELDGTRASLSQAVRAISWDTLSPDERSGALWLIYKQVEDVAAVALLDERGQGVGATAYLAPDAAEDPEYATHPRASLQTLTEFSRRIPFTQAGRQGFAYGEVFDSSGQRAPLIPLGIPVKGKDGQQWMVAAALSLRHLCQAVSSAAAHDATLLVFEPNNRVLCAPSAPDRLIDPEPALLDAIREGPTAEGALAHYGARDGTDSIAAVVAAPSGWRLAVIQAADVAYAANRAMLRQTAGWLLASLLLALTVGLLLARKIIRPVRQLLEGAQALTHGSFDHRLSVESTDELGQLSQAFNDMGTEIVARDREIRAFNEELQARVDQRTRELREAQEQLLHSQKMAAVTGLGAGFAHEINNPLTSVIGLTQILINRKKSNPDGSQELMILDHVQEQAHRIRKIVRTLLSLSQNYGGADGYAPIELNQLLDDTIRAVQEKLSEAQVEVIKHFGDGLPVVRGNKAQLQQVFLNVFNNSRTAMIGVGGTLTIATGAVAGQAVRIEVSDTGRGIPPEHVGKIFDPFFTTKDEWRSEGLGLTVANRVVEQHKGRIQVQSEPGKGTTLTITLPAAPSGPHLA